MPIIPIDHTTLLKGAITVEHAERVVKEFGDECFVAESLTRGPKESDKDWKARQEAARHIADTQLASQLADASTQVLTGTLIKLFQAKEHWHVEEVPDMPADRQVDYYLDIVLGDAISPALRSKIKLVVVEVVPALKKYGIKIEGDVAKRLGLNGNTPVSSRPLYAAAQGLQAAAKSDKLNADLAKDVAAAIRSDKTEPEMRQIFVAHGVISEPIRLEAEGTSCRKDKTLTFTITAPDNIDVARLKDQIEHHISVGSFKQGDTTVVVHFNFS